MTNLRDGAGSTNIVPLTFSFLCSMFLMGIVSTLWAALRRAPGHFDLLGDPVDLLIMLLKPRMAQDQLLLAQATDSKGGSL